MFKNFLEVEGSGVLDCFHSTSKSDGNRVGCCMSFYIGCQVEVFDSKMKRKLAVLTVRNIKEKTGELFFVEPIPKSVKKGSLILFYSKNSLT